jgi:uroporphyrinogen-III synthase
MAVAFPERACAPLSASPTRPCVIVTRPQPQASQWVERLQALGLQARALPLLSIAEAPQPEEVERAWRALHRQALVMFVSPNAVERFFALKPPGQPPWPAATWAGSTGPGTEAALLGHGVPPEAVVTPPAQAGQFDAEALWRELQPRRDWSGASVLVVRGEGGRDWLAETLKAAGAHVEFLAAYRRGPPVLDDADLAWVRSALHDPQSYVWHFSSSEAIGHLRRVLPDADWSRAQAVGTHPRIVETARQLGLGRVSRVGVSPEAVVAQLTRSIQSPRP